MTTRAAIATTLAATFLAVFGVVIGPASADPPAKVTICHATSDIENPYAEIPVSTSALDGSGQNNHSGHTGPLFDFSDPAANSGWGDIIPPADGVTARNYDLVGAAILAAHCQAPGSAVGTTDGGSTDGGSTDDAAVTDGGTTDGGSTGGTDGSGIEGTDGGSTDGSTDGGSTDGGSTDGTAVIDGGTTDGGSTGGTDGGTTDGGSTGGTDGSGIEGTDGGSTGGSTDGGSTDGGSTDGGTTDGGSTTDGGTTGGDTADQTCAFDATLDADDPACVEPDATPSDPSSAADPDTDASGIEVLPSVIFPEPAVSGAPTTLPKTGSDVSTTALVGLGLLALGVALVATQRRRERLG